MRFGGKHKTKLNYLTYQTKFDAKMTKMERNYMANIIMKYQEQFVNFPGKQGLAIKSKRIELFDIISCQMPGGGVINFLFGRGGRSTLTNY